MLKYNKAVCWKYDNNTNFTNMKKSSIILVCLLYMQFVRAQETVGSNAFVCADTWYGVEYDYMDREFTGVTYYLDEDTIIGGNTYRTLWRTQGYMIQTMCVGALRQSEDGMKVYFYNLFTLGDVAKQEYLLYDFTVNIGDTIRDAYFRLEDMRLCTDFMGEPESVGWLVADKYVRDGRIHIIVERCYDDNNITPRYRTHWIQGIGTANVLWPVDYGMAGITTLYALCATQGDTQLYSYDVSYLRIVNNCSEWQLITTDMEKNSASEQQSKHLRDGQLYIRVGDVDYTILGMPKP